MTAELLFPAFGVRLSTWLALFVFAGIAAWRSEREPLLAALAWLAGFEGAYQVAAVLLHTPPRLPFIGSISISLIVGMPLIAVAMTLLGARPDPVLLGLAAVVFVVWLATGFHVNTSPSAINPAGEALNEGAKTLWALAYLVPLLRHRTGRDKFVAV